MGTENKEHPVMYMIKNGDTLRSVCETYGLDIEWVKRQVMNIWIFSKR